MIRIIIFIICVMMLVGCRTSTQKRVNKDIIGINEQLYDLEKSQIKLRHQLTDIKKEVGMLNKEKEEQNTKQTENERDKIYKEGYRYYLEQNYPKALELLSQLTANLTDNQLADNALYWQAEAYFKLNKTDKALNYYQMVYSFFPFSNKADYSLYKIGMIFYNKKDFNKALSAFDRLVREYPGSDLYKAALIKSRQIKKKNRSKR